MNDEAHIGRTSKLRTACPNSLTEVELGCGGVESKCRTDESRLCRLRACPAFWGKHRYVSKRHRMGRRSTRKLCAARLVPVASATPSLRPVRSVRAEKVLRIDIPTVLESVVEELEEWL
jgi:hypothetical protein